MSAALLAAAVSEAEQRANSKNSVVPAAVSAALCSIAAELLASFAVPDNVPEQNRKATRTLRGVSLLLSKGTAAAKKKKSRGEGGRAASSSPSLLRSLTVIHRVGDRGQRGIVDEIERALAV